MNTTDGIISVYENWTEFDSTINNNNITNGTGEASDPEPAWQAWLDISQIVISIIGRTIFLKLTKIKRVDTLKCCALYFETQCIVRQRFK